MIENRNSRTPKSIIAISLMALCLSSCGDQAAETGPVVSESGYAIDVLRLDGTNDLGIEPDVQLEPAQQTTIEFWVQADWSSNPGFDPVVVSNPGDEGVSYLVAIDGERDGLVVAAGDKIDVAPFDFSDGKMHHVALIDYGGTTTVLVDDENVAELELGFEPMDSQGLFFGSFNGGDELFTGSIGAFRQWDVAVNANVVRQFRQRDATDPANPHPDLEHLAAISDFGNNRVVYITQ